MPSRCLQVNCRAKLTPKKQPCCGQYAKCPHYYCIADAKAGSAEETMTQPILPITYSLLKIDDAAAAFLRLLENHSVIALHGAMGAGKTTLISHAVALSGASDMVTSPTFAIMNQYRLGNGNLLWHMDWYRLSSEEEAIDAGVEDTIYSGHKVVIEWPDRFPDLLPSDALHLAINLTADGERILTFI